MAPVIRELQAGHGCQHGVAAMGNVRERPGMHECGAAFERLQQVRLDRVAQQRRVPHVALEPDGEEIAQDTFLALFQHLRDGGDRANIRGWLFRVAHNLALKRRQVAARKVSLDESKILSGFDAEDPGPNPETGAVEQQAFARILSAWRALPELDQRCLDGGAGAFVAGVGAP